MNSHRSHLHDPTLAMPRTDDIPTVVQESTGKERWTRLVRLEAIAAEIRVIVLKRTVRPRATVPEHYHWARDNRRGRANVYGGLFRLVDVMARKADGDAEKIAEARTDALSILGLCRQYVDETLPAPVALHPTLGRRIERPITRQEQRA